MALLNHRQTIKQAQMMIIKWSTFAASVWLGLAITALDTAAVQAQSLSIQSWNSFGVPRSGIRFGVPYGGLGPPGYHSYRHGFIPYGGRSGFSLSIGIPRTSYDAGYGYGYGYAHPYDHYRHQNDYFDYRTDYYNRVYDSYRYGLRRDLYTAYPEYGYGTFDPFASSLDYPSYRPPVARIEPFESQGYQAFGPYADNQAVVPSSRTFQSPSHPAAGIPAANLPQSLRAAANRLSISLSRRSTDGDVWLEYLAPGRIIAAIDQTQSPDSMVELLRNYDGVTANHELRSIAAADGFELTRTLLRQWVDSRESRVPEKPAPKAPIPPQPDLDLPAEASLPTDPAPEDRPTQQRASI